MEDFEKNVSAISKLVFSINGFFRRCEIRTYTMDDEHLYLDVDSPFALDPKNFNNKPNYLCSKDEFLEGLRELHIGEWRRKYDLRRFGYMALDGIDWKFISLMAINL